MSKYFPLTVLLLPLLFISCFANQQTKNKLRTELTTAQQESQDDEIISLSLQLLPLLSESEEKVAVTTTALFSATSLENEELMLKTLQLLNNELVAWNAEFTLSELPHNSPRKEVYKQTEIALREANFLTFALIGPANSPSKILRETFYLSSEMYCKFFTTSILYSDILIKKAEFKMQYEARREAIPLLELAIEKDYTGKNTVAAKELIRDIWTQESFKSELPTNITKMTTIPTPHKEWIKISYLGSNSDSDPDQVMLFNMHRSRIMLAYGHLEEGYTSLEHIIQQNTESGTVEAAIILVEHAVTRPKMAGFLNVYERLEETNPAIFRKIPFRRNLFEISQRLLKEDPIKETFSYRIINDLIEAHNDNLSLEAATTMLLFASEHENQKEFRIIRKQLQKNKYLWKHKEFRLLVFNLKNKVAGK